MKRDVSGMVDKEAAGTVVWATTAQGRRPQLIAMALRRARPGSGSSIDFLRTRTWSEPAVNLHRLKTPFVIVDGVATALYMPERVTHDTDLLVRPEDAADIEGELAAAGGERTDQLSVGGTIWRFPTGKLDVLALDAPWVSDAVSHPNRSPSGLPVIALPYLVLMKLASSRTIDLGDLSRMLRLADEQTRRHVIAAVQTHRPSDLADVESLIVLGELEIKGNESA